MSRLLAAIACLFLFSLADAQEKWDLQKCVDYALTHNISVKQADLQVRFSQITYEENKGNQLPTINFGVNAGYSFGLTENPTTGVLENRKNFSTTSSLQSGLTLFNWFSLRNQVAAGKLALRADQAQAIKAQNDVALNVAVAYLQALLADQQVHLAAVTVQQDQSQWDLTRKKVNAGILPELNSAELEAQLASDSSNLIGAQATYQQYVLQLKALLALDAGAPFELVTPAVEFIPVEDLADLQPEQVYQMALSNLPQQRANELRIQSANKMADAAHGQMYPVISAFGNLNTRYAFYRVPTYAQVITGYQTSPLRVDAGGGSFYNVQTPIIAQGGKTGYLISDPLGTQLSQNFGQGIGLGIQVPILNGRRARLGWYRARLSVQQLQLQNDLDKQTLKQDIYQAYVNATASIEKYNASKKAVAAAEKAFDYAQKRYNVNLLSTYDLLSNQARLNSARIQMVSARFDYVFRLKLLEFYKGQGLKL